MFCTPRTVVKSSVDGGLYRGNLAVLGLPSPAALSHRELGGRARHRLSEGFPSPLAASLRCPELLKIDGDILLFGSV